MEMNVLIDFSRVLLTRETRGKLKDATEVFHLTHLYSRGKKK